MHTWREDGQFRSAIPSRDDVGQEGKFCVVVVRGSERLFVLVGQEANLFTMSVL